MFVTVSTDSIWMLSRTVSFHQAAYSRRATGAVRGRRPRRLAPPQLRRPIGP